MFVTVKFRALLVSCAAAALCVATQAVPGVSGKPKTLSAKDARRLIAALPGLELKTSAVNVKGVSGDGASAEAAVGVRTAFRFARGEGDKWLVREVRVGDRKWEDVPLLAAALKTGPETSAAFLSDLEALAAEVEALLRQAKEGGPAPTGVNQAGKNRGDEFIIRGPFAVPVNSLSGLLSSATVEAEVATNFRFAKDARNRWRVAGVRVGAGEWRDFGALVSA
ncbi:MAG: hypothetical protein ACRD68_17155, partial [Pyrinomonadaceae bacterium]